MSCILYRPHSFVKVGLKARKIKELKKYILLYYSGLETLKKKKHRIFLQCCSLICIVIIGLTVNSSQLQFVQGVQKVR